MNLLNSLFKPNEVKQALLVMKTLPNKGIELNYELTQELRKLLINNSDSLRKTMNSGLTAEDVVFNALLSLTNRSLCYGEYHVYRGILGIEGNEIKKQNEICIQRLLKLGQWSKEDAQTYRDELRQNISEVG